MIQEPKYFLQTIEFIRSKGYIRNYKTLLKILRQSRLPFLRHNRYFLSILQLGVIQTIVYLQDEISILNKKRADAIKNNQDVSAIDKALRGNKETLRVIFTIMDGVVARTFKFDRPILRVMSENKQLGHLRKAEFDHIGLLNDLVISLRSRGICIANDITRYLRIGDATVIDEKGKTIIYEAKTDTTTGETKLIDAGSIYTNILANGQPLKNRQYQRQLTAQMAIVNRRISIPEIPSTLGEPYKERIGIDILDIGVKIKNHLKEAKKALMHSKKEIISHYDLEDGYSISILRCDKMLPENLKETLDSFNSSAPKWFDKKSPTMFMVSNLQTFISEDGEFARNLLPYSVFPFDAEDCLKLITGDIYISIFLDATKIKQKLEQSGWTVEVGDLVKILESNEPYEKKKRDTSEMFKERDLSVFILSKNTEHGIFKTSLLATQLLPFMFSFYSTDFVVDIVNTQFELSEPGENRYITHNYSDEKSIYI